MTHPVTVTLTFTSVQAAIAALSAIPADSVQGSIGIVPKDTIPEKPKAEKAAPAPKAAPPAAAATPPSAAPAPTAATAADAVDYVTLQKAVFELAGIVKGQGLDANEHVVSIAKHFGFDSFKDMKAAGVEGAKHFAAALAKVSEKIDELSTAVA